MKCNICPRNCNVERNENVGYCKSGKLKIAKTMLHFWEEPIISGTKGSGAIFFSGCNLNCVFCQNYEISQKNKGEELNVLELVEIFKKFEELGAHNINLVSPTQFTTEILAALKIYKPKIPVVWNSNGYEKPETIEKLKGFVDIFLVDFKYFNNDLAIKYSKAPNYFENASKTILKMREVVSQDITYNNIMQKGLIIRHLILPTHYKDSIKILDYINEKLGNQTYVSLMSQYLPLNNSPAPINRKISPLEYKIVVNHALKLNFENCFCQELTSANSNYIPKF